MVNVYKIFQKVCENCEAKKACGNEEEVVIINTGNMVTGNPTERKDKSFAYGGQKGEDGRAFIWEIPYDTSACKRQRRRGVSDRT